jgi:hypothetical protein
VILPPPRDFQRTEIVLCRSDRLHPHNDDTLRFDTESQSLLGLREVVVPKIGTESAGLNRRDDEAIQRKRRKRSLKRSDLKSVNPVFAKRKEHLQESNDRLFERCHILKRLLSKNLKCSKENTLNWSHCGESQ